MLCRHQLIARDISEAGALAMIRNEPRNDLALSKIYMQRNPCRLLEAFDIPDASVFVISRFHRMERNDFKTSANVGFAKPNRKAVHFRNRCGHAQPKTIARDVVG